MLHQCQTKDKLIIYAHACFVQAPIKIQYIMIIQLNVFYSIFGFITKVCLRGQERKLEDEYIGWMFI